MSEEPTSPAPQPAADLHGLDPGELLARGLHTVKASAGSGPWEPPTPEVLARLLPQYRIESLLGRGGMGAVYQGRQESLDRPVAIKLLPAELAADADFLARFQREARTLAKLQHSGIVTVYDFGQTSAGHPYFVMEYVDGTDLQQILKSPGLKPEQAFELIAQICDALYYAHRQGVIHRDIKPANILLTKDGRAKVADFGLARPLTEESGGLTMTNMVMGTPDYMAPEQRTSATHADHRADIFALGVMLYEMLTGQRPHGAFQPASQRVQVDVRIDEVVIKAMQQEPERRYQQASEMKSDVDRIRTTPPTPAKVPRSKLVIAAAVIISIIVSVISVPILTYFLAKGPVAPSVESSAKSSPAATAQSALPWQTLDRTSPQWDDKVLLVDGDGWIEFRTTGETPHQISLTAAAPSNNPGLFRDTALRVRYRWNPQQRRKPGLYLSGRNRAESGRAEAWLTGGAIALDVSGGDGVNRQRMLPQALKPTEEGTFELAMIGQRMLVRLNGQVIFDEVSTVLNRTGSLKVRVQHCLLRDIQHVNLDGVSDPLEALGWEVPAIVGSTAGASPSASTANATKDAPFTNALGMKFVPVPGTDILMCIHETRRRDYTAYADSAPGVDATWKNPLVENKLLIQGDDHPVVQVSWQDTSGFCAWLSKKEGRIYRLPTEREWNLAAVFDVDDPGSISDADLTKVIRPQFPWGTRDEKDALKYGNYTGKDGYEGGTAPVMGFLPNRLGIFDLGGNAWEWCEGWFDDKQEKRVLRGCGFMNYGPYRASSTREGLDPSYRSPIPPLDAFNRTWIPGFRCVLEPAPSERAAKVDGQKPAVATPSASVLEARERGGRLRVFGTSFRGPVELGKAAEFTDFQNVVLGSSGWAARRVGGLTFCMSGFGTNPKEKATEFGPYHTSFLQREKHPVMRLSHDGSIRNIFAGGSQHRTDLAHQEATAYLNPGDYNVLLAKDGRILISRHWADYNDRALGQERSVRKPPPTDFFLGATAYTVVSDHYISARPGLSVRSFSTNTGQTVDFPGHIRDIVEMDTSGSEIILRDAAGRVFVTTAKGEKFRVTPTDLGPAIAVRAGSRIFAAQLADGTWRAWGEATDLIEQTVKIGAAIDVDYYSAGPGKPGFMLWIEPVEMPKPADANATTEAKKRLAEARAHLKAGDLAEARQLVGAALTAAPGDLGTMADAALIFADAQAPERAAELAQEFVAKADAEHPQFATITELRVKWGPKLKDYRARLDAATKLAAAHDDAGEIRELKAALALVPDGQQAADKLAANPLHVGRALPGRKFTNELSHTFLPVEGLPNVLFSIWETRVKDFEQFVKETGYDMSQPRAGSLKNINWQKLGFEQTGDHPVVMVTRYDAEAFCRWLTTKERAAGRLLPGQVYRLPTDREWSAAMGVLNEPGDFPENRQFPKDVFTWEKGTQPPRNAENCFWKNDDFPNTAPVGSGLANRFGLYDMIGNVKEICADPWGFSSSPSIVLRGGSFRLPETWAHQRDTVSGGFVGHQTLDRAKVDAGFRCVLDLKSEAMRRVQTDLEAAVEKFHAHKEGKRVEFTTLATDEMVLLDMARWGYPSPEALGIFAELPVTHLFVPGGAFRKPFDALKKMPLRVLCVDNLFPEENFLETVRGLPLQWVLIDQNVQGKMSITSLGPLAGMKLKGLDLGNFKSLENFEPLRGMPLEALHLRGSTPTLDLKPLKGAPLVHLSVPKDAPRQWLLEASSFFPTLARGLDFSAAQLLAPVKAALALGNDREAARLLAEDEKVFADRLWWSGEFGKSLRDDYGKMRAAIAVASLVRRAREGDFAEIIRDAKVFNGHAYLLVRGAITFDDGQRAAQALGGHLVTITSKEENDFLKREFMTAKDAPREILIGARREGTEGGWHGWKWVTGEEFPFTDWSDHAASSKPAAGLHVGLHGGGGMGKWWYTTGPRQAIIIEWDTPTPQPPAR